MPTEIKRLFRFEAVRPRLGLIAIPGTGSSYCQMLWTGFDSGGVLDLDPIDEFGP